MKILNILLISQCIFHLRRQESSQGISLLDPKDSAGMLCHLCTLLGLLRVKKSLMELGVYLGEEKAWDAGWEDS